jgi:hypothetical protein
MEKGSEMPSLGGYTLAGSNSCHSTVEKVMGPNYFVFGESTKKHSSHMTTKGHHTNSQRKQTEVRRLGSDVDGGEDSVGKRKNMNGGGGKQNKMAKRNRREREEEEYHEKDLAEVAWQPRRST